MEMGSGAWESHLRRSHFVPHPPFSDKVPNFYETMRAQWSEAQKPLILSSTLIFQMKKLQRSCL